MEERARQTLIQNLVEDRLLLSEATSDDFVAFMNAFSNYNPLISAIKVIPEPVSRTGFEMLQQDSIKMFDDSISLLKDWRYEAPVCLDKSMKDMIVKVLRMEVIDHMLPDIEKSPYSKGINSDHAYDEVESAINELAAVPACR